MEVEGGGWRGRERTQIQGWRSASEEVMRLGDESCSICWIRCFASGVTVSHSGDGNCARNHETHMRSHYTYITDSHYVALILHDTDSIVIAPEAGDRHEHEHLRGEAARVLSRCLSERTRHHSILSTRHSILDTH